MVSNYRCHISAIHPIGPLLTALELCYVTSVSSAPDYTDWKTLHRAATLETNKNVIQQKVSEAEEAVLARQRELFHTDGTREEQESLEDALYVLHAYRSDWEHTEAA